MSLLEAGRGAVPPPGRRESRAGVLQRPLVALRGAGGAPGGAPSAPLCLSSGAHSCPLRRAVAVRTSFLRSSTAKINVKVFHCSGRGLLGFVKIKCLKVSLSCSKIIYGWLGKANFAEMCIPGLKSVGRKMCL